MKRKFLVLIVALVALIVCVAVVVIVLINNKGNSPTGGEKTPPTIQQWTDAGISGTFNVEVKGTLAESNVSKDGEISMKWTGSDEASLDNTITWLKG